MATEAVIIESEKRRNDNVLLADDLADLASIFAGTGEITLLIQRDGLTFNLTGLRGKLTAGTADQATAIAAIETAVETAVGATTATAGSIRKAVNDLVVANDAYIAAA